MQDPTVSNTADLDAVASSLRKLALDNGLEVIGAVYRAPDVAADAQTPLATLINAARSSGAPFVTVLSVPYSNAGLLTTVGDDLEEDDKTFGDEIDAILEAEAHREGQTERVALMWAARGTVYECIFVADWYSELEERARAAAVDAEVDDSFEILRRDRERHYARVQELARQLEAMPDFRMTTPRMRKPMGTRLVAGLLSPEDEPGIGTTVVGDAANLASSNAASAFLAFESEQLQAAEELAATPEWKMARTAPHRSDVAIKFVAERTGYSPSKTDADAFRRVVEMAARS